MDKKGNIQTYVLTESQQKNEQLNQRNSEKGKRKSMQQNSAGEVH
jgi:hypothetical protein